MTQSANCNTKISNSRGWTFTLNNYTEDDITFIQSIPCKYCFQEETGEQGTKHLQGFLYFGNATTFKHIKDLLPKAHIEKMKSLPASKKYCSKENTRTGKIYTNFEDILKKLNTLHSKKLTLQEKLEKEKNDILEQLIYWQNVKNKYPAEYLTDCPEWISEILDHKIWKKGC